jgi:hypothetical protein
MQHDPQRRKIVSASHFTPWKGETALDQSVEGDSFTTERTCSYFRRYQTRSQSPKSDGEQLEAECAMLLIEQMPRQCPTLFSSVRLYSPVSDFILTLQQYRHASLPTGRPFSKTYRFIPRRGYNAFGSCFFATSCTRGFRFVPALVARTERCDCPRNSRPAAQD